MSKKTIYSEPYREVVQRLRAKREAAGVTQAELARKLGWPQQRLSAVEIGSRRVDVMEFFQLTAALGLSPNEALQLVISPDQRTRSRRQSPKGTS